jgi:hypothetical protein
VDRAIGPDWTSFPIAQLRFNRTTRLWQLYWRDADLGWHRYIGVSHTACLDPC